MLFHFLTHFAPVPTAIYGGVMFCSAIAYTVLQNCIVAHHGPDSRLAKAIGRDFKGRISLAGYAVAIALAFVKSELSAAIYVGVALIWLVPDRRIERVVS